MRAKLVTKSYGHFCPYIHKLPILVDRWWATNSIEIAQQTQSTHWGSEWQKRRATVVAWWRLHAVCLTLCGLISDELVTRMRMHQRSVLMMCVLLRNFRRAVRWDCRIAGAACLYCLRLALHAKCLMLANRSNERTSQVPEFSPKLSR